jgi:hypothetical protein
MGQTALLPLRRKECCGFFRPGSNPRSWVPEASVLTTRPPKPLWLIIHLLYVVMYLLCGGPVCTDRCTPGRHITHNAVLSTIAFDSHVTQQARKCSLMMTHTCRNMYERQNKTINCFKSVHLLVIYKHRTKNARYEN